MTESLAMETLSCLPWLLAAPAPKWPPLQLCQHQRRFAVTLFSICIALWTQPGPGVAAFITRRQHVLMKPSFVCLIAPGLHLSTANTPLNTTIPPPARPCLLSEKTSECKEWRRELRTASNWQIASVLDTSDVINSS